MKPLSRPKSLVAGLPANDQLQRFVKKFCSLKLSEFFNYEVFGKILARQISERCPSLRRVHGKSAKIPKHQNIHVASSVIKDRLKGRSSPSQKQQIRGRIEVENDV